MTGPLLAKLPDRFTETAIDDEVVLMTLAGGDFFSLRGTGKAIWEKIDGERARDAIVAELATEYAVPAEQIAVEVDGFVAQLQQAGLITGG